MEARETPSPPASPPRSLTATSSPTLPPFSSPFLDTAFNPLLGSPLAFPLPTSPSFLLSEPKLEPFVEDFYLPLFHPQAGDTCGASSSRDIGGEAVIAVPQPLKALHETPVPPFLSKTFDLVDEPALDPIVSWSSSGSSFVVWDPVEFSRSVLPRHFKHNNFSSFVRQLNTYIDIDRWEFTNENFLRGKKTLLRNIHRRRSSQIHQISTQVSTSTETGESTLEGEVHRLKEEKNLLVQEVSMLRQEHLTISRQMDTVNQRLQSAESRQKQMVSFLAKVLQNPSFLASLRQMKEQRENAQVRTKFLGHQQAGPSGPSEPIGAQMREQPIIGASKRLAIRSSNEPGEGPTKEALLDPSASAFKRKDAMAFETYGSLGQSEYVSFPEATAATEELPGTGVSSRKRKHILTIERSTQMGLTLDAPSMMPVYEDPPKKQDSPVAATSSSDIIFKQDDIWQAGLEVGGAPFTSTDDVWDMIIQYDAPEAQVALGPSALWDVDTSLADGGLAIIEHLVFEPSCLELGTETKTKDDSHQDREQ